MDLTSLFIGEQIEWRALDVEKDAATLAGWTADPLTSQSLFADSNRPRAVHEVKKKFTEDLKKAEEKRNAYYFAICKKGQEDLLALLRFDWMLLQRQVSRVIVDCAAPEVIEPFGEELMRMALRYAFMELALHRLWVELPACSTQMIALFERAGFLREIQRREAIFLNGNYYDLLSYSLLKPEWKKGLQTEVLA